MHLFCFLAELADCSAELDGEGSTALDTAVAALEGPATGCLQPLNQLGTHRKISAISRFQCYLDKLIIGVRSLWLSRTRYRWCPFRPCLTKEIPSFFPLVFGYIPVQFDSSSSAKRLEIFQYFISSLAFDTRFMFDPSSFEHVLSYVLDPRAGASRISDKAERNATR